MAELLVDWISLTYPAGKAADVHPGLVGDSERLHEFAHHIAKADADFTVRAPRHGYKYVAQNGEGVSVLWNGPGSAQGLHITYPGSALAERDALALIEFHVKRGARCTRLDIAIDVYTDEMTVSQLAALRQGEQCQTRSRAYSHIQSSTGETLYIGSRTSEQFLRIYDKGAEQGNEWDEHLRIELELKGGRAEWAAKRLYEDGLHVIPGIVLNFADFPTCEKWADAFSNHHKLKGNRTVKQRDVDRWILYKIIPTIARRFVENPDLEKQFKHHLALNLRMRREISEACEIEIEPKRPE